VSSPRFFQIPRILLIPGQIKNLPDCSGYFLKFSILVSCLILTRKRRQSGLAWVVGFLSNAPHPETICNQNSAKPRNSAHNSLVLTILRNNPFAFKDLEQMIKTHLAQKKELRPETPVGG
jgi:hypothetical protein